MRPEQRLAPEGRGESHGEWLVRIILEEVTKRGSDGLLVDEVLPILQTKMSKHETAIGGNPENIKGALDNDDVSSPLLDLKEKGKIRLENGRIYLN